jgi:hypothetical protein
MRRRERRGSIVVLVAVLMVVLLGFGAFAVDVSQMQAYKSELRRTADAAALAATQELLTNPPGASARAAAYVAANPVMGSQADSVEYSYGLFNGTNFDPLPPALAAEANAYRVTVRSSGDFYLAQFLGGDDFDVQATATAWLPVSTNPCVKPWAVLKTEMDLQLPNWSSIPLASLRLMSDASSLKVFTLKSDLPGFAGVVNLPAYFDASLGAHYPGFYSATTYTQSISSGCHTLNPGDTVQTKVGPYNPETANGILGNVPGTNAICSTLLSGVCHNLGGQMGVAVRVAVIRDLPGLTVGCGVTPLDPMDDYGTPGASEVLCGYVEDVVTFVLTRALITVGETLVIGSYAGHDDTGPVNGFAQRPILVE